MTPPSHTPLKSRLQSASRICNGFAPCRDSEKLVSQLLLTSVSTALVFIFVSDRLDWFCLTVVPLKGLSVLFKYVFLLNRVP